MAEVRDMFQSLSGFFRPCNRMAGLLGVAGRVSFNPCRVFSGLATSIREIRGLSEKEFQSLSGFFRPCDALPPLSSDTRPSVSIPVGFFQALQRWSCGRLSPPVTICFNPCRVFSGLATGDRAGRDRTATACFNPCRVFSGLATSSRQLDLDFPRLFQSLSGFFRPCNNMTRRRPSSEKRFQSLSGFFRPCNLTAFRAPLHLSPFQSLSGFFRPCNKEVKFNKNTLLRFNPCRVFSGLATLHPLKTVSKFLFVSIPVGFFQALQPIDVTLGPKAP